jgi:hypothetical protein
MKKIIIFLFFTSFVLVENLKGQEQYVDSLEIKVGLDSCLATTLMGPTYVVNTSPNTLVGIWEVEGKLIDYIEGTGNIVWYSTGVGKIALTSNSISDPSQIIYVLLGENARELIHSEGLVRLRVRFLTKEDLKPYDFVVNKFNITDKFLFIVEKLN